MIEIKICNHSWWNEKWKNLGAVYNSWIQCIKCRKTWDEYLIEERSAEEKTKEQQCKLD